MAAASPATSPPTPPSAVDSQVPMASGRGNGGQVDEHTELAFGQRWKDAAKPKRPSIANMGDAHDGRRKSSVQFHTVHAEETIRRESLAKVPTLSSTSRRKSSPPPPATYKRGVSFDTFDNRDAPDYSFTMQYKHKDYVHSRRSRTFLCGADDKDYSEFALEWLIDELVEDGDEIVCLRVVDKDSKVASNSSIESGKYKEQAKKLLDSVIKKNNQEDKAISLIMEMAVGRVQDVIQRTVRSPVQFSPVQRMLHSRLIRNRYKYTSLLLSLWGPEVEIWVVCRAFCLALFQSTAYSPRQSLSSWSGHLPSEQRKSRSVPLTQALPVLCMDRCYTMPNRWEEATPSTGIATTP